MPPNPVVRAWLRCSLCQYAWCRCHFTALRLHTGAHSHALTYSTIVYAAYEQPTYGVTLPRCESAEGDSAAGIVRCEFC